MALKEAGRDCGQDSQPQVTGQWQVLVKAALKTLWLHESQRLS